MFNVPLPLFGRWRRRLRLLFSLSLRNALHSMQHLIASYLFQNKTCPLPGLGTLSIINSAAELDFTNKLIAAPKASVQFVNTESDATGLMNYIAASTGSNNYEVTEALDHFCDDLKDRITKESGVTLDEIGNLVVDRSSKIKFKQAELPSAFFQPVIAERVIHPQAEHQILVGDKETTNTVMAEFLTEKPVVSDRWWIWAIVLGAIGLLLLLIYFSEANGTSPFGNAIKI